MIFVPTYIATYHKKSGMMFFNTYASMNCTNLDDHSFCCFELASTASLAALIEAEGSVSDNGPSGSGNLLDLKYH